jgi:hypothetical protein
MAQRLTEDFVRHHKLLVERTGNNPHGVRRALEKHPDVAVSIRELDRFWHVIESHRKSSKRRLLVQTDPLFPKTLDDYRSRWLGVVVDLWDWEAEKAGQEPLSAWVERELSSPSQLSEADATEDDDWDFDPDLHSAASHIEGIADYISDKADDQAFFSRAKGAFDWIRNTVGVDLEALETRWREFPVIAVPQQVSDAHGLNDPQSLFAYLDNIRLAYVAGAFLASIAMCRAATEIMIRHHYNAKDDSTKLSRLIEQTQGRREFAFMRSFNLVAKVNEANEILHSNRDDIRNADRSRALIREWIQAIQVLIARAPR